MTTTHASRQRRVVTGREVPLCFMLAVACLSGQPASAQEQPATDDTEHVTAAPAVNDTPSVAVDDSSSGATGVIAYSRIDLATVQVFAVGRVDMVNAHGRTGRERVIAAPVAGHGSGLLFARNGLVLTAHHVVEGARYVAVAMPRGAASGRPCRSCWIRSGTSPCSPSRATTRTSFPSPMRRTGRFASGRP